MQCIVNSLGRQGVKTGYDSFLTSYRYGTTIPVTFLLLCSTQTERSEGRKREISKINCTTNIYFIYVLKKRKNYIQKICII